MGPGSAHRRADARRCWSATTALGVVDLRLKQQSKGVGPRNHSLAARHARGLRSVRPSQTAQRAQGMPGDSLTHGPPAKKMQAAGTTGKAETRRHSLRGGLHAYTQSPWCAGLLATIRDDALSRAARDTSFGVSGRCDFTSASDRSSAPSSRRRCDLSRPPHPRLACRDDRALRPYCSEAGCGELIMIFGNTQEDYFFRNSRFCEPVGSEARPALAAAVRSLSPFFTGRGLG